MSAISTHPGHGWLPRSTAESQPSRQGAGLAALQRLAQPLQPPADSVSGRTGVLVVIPARDEGASILDSLRSVAQQTLRADKVVVVVNNCSDDTAEIAREYVRENAVPDVEVIEMPGFNRHRKAGALNYGIRRFLRGGQLPAECRYLLVMDGDTELDAHFILRAARILQRDPALGGVSAACLGKPLRGSTRWSELLLLIQKIEYGRYSATRLRRNVHTMSGAGSFYRSTALNDLLARREDVFDERESNLVEDYETTLALKVCGWRVTSNQKCIAYTDLMPTLRMLLAQRVRWVRGTIDEWRRYGWCRPTRLSIAATIACAAGVLYTVLWGGLSVRAVILHGAHPDYHYLWLAAFWSAYQGLSVKHMGWKAILFEMLILPELLFNFARYYWLIKAVHASYRGRNRVWS